MDVYKHKQQQASFDGAQYEPKPLKADEITHLAQEIRLAHEYFSAAIASNNKDQLRAFHLAAKRTTSGYNADNLRLRFEKRLKYFKSGHVICPHKIQPRLQLVDSTLWEDLFAIARGCWSMPFNKGYGRRLRFVVFDDYHESVIGVIGLQSPPADLKSRDALFAYPKGEKLELINNTLDAYTVGAIPPYSFLLGGKLCAGLISSDTIRRMYWRKYIQQKSVMSEKKISQPLVAVTTTSAFGRSSIYNRLRYQDRLLAQPIGYTEGFGTIHLEHLYDQMATILRRLGTYTPGGFGNGPKVRWQNITRALIHLGVEPKLLQHGLKREVFLFRLVEDLEQGMGGGLYGAPLRLEEKDFSHYWLNRWAIARSKRYPEWANIDSINLIRSKLHEL